MSEHARQAAQTLRDALQTPFGSLEELCQVLAQPLYAFDLISQPTYAAHKAARDDDTWLQLDSADKAYIIKVYWSQFQEILATKVVVDWLHELRKAHLDNALWIPFFCPPKASDYALQIARISLTTLLSILGNKPSKEKLSSVVQKKTVLPEFVRDTCMFLLQQQIKQFTLFDYFRGLYVASAGSRKGLPEWQAFVDVYFSLPAKVSNTTLDGRGVPTMLEWRAFCVSLSRQLEQVMCATSLEAKANLCLPGLSYAIAKIARSGFMGFDKGHTSFWSAILPKLKHRLLSSSYKQQIGQLWQAVTADLSTADFRTFFLSLISALDDGNGHEAIPREIKQASVLLTRLIGGAQVDDGRAFPIAIRGVLLARAWKSSMARILVLWIKGSENSGNPCEFTPLYQLFGRQTSADVYMFYSFG